MRGLRADLIIASVILSAVIHFGIMYYAKPMVMTRVTNRHGQVMRRGPMKVSEAPNIPEPVSIDTVKDIDPEKGAPEAEGTMEVAPKLDARLPENVTDLSVPEVEMPEISTAEIPVEHLPEVMASEMSEVAAPALKMITDKTSVPTEPEKIVHMPTVMEVAELPSAPVVAMPDLAVADLPTSQAEEKVVNDLANDDKGEVEVPEFVPPPEVMEKVDVNIVEAEKDAVRNLVDSMDALDLSEVVDISLTRAPTQEWEYFRVKIAPKADGLKPVAKDVVVLIDASGSIGKDRMRSIREAAKRILRSVANTGDRFNFVAFRDKFSYAFRSWQGCTTQSFEAADKWLSSVVPFGRTDVFATISSVLTLPRDPSRPLIAMVVTDGDANAGVSDTAKILSKFSKLNDGLVSVYMYGVKSSANRELIDVLTRGNRGESFIFEGSSWQAGSRIDTLSNMFRDPLLSDLRVVYSSECRAESYPRLLKNLYRDGTVEFVGRVPAGTKEVAFSLKGLNGKDAYEAFFRLPLTGNRIESALDHSWRDANEIDRKLR